MNKVILIGRVGKDPEIRQTPNGMAVANISLATSKKIKGEEHTQWHRITFYDKLAEIVGNYVTKGAMIAVEGEIKYGKFTDKNGIEKYTTDIICQHMQMIGGRPPQGEDPQRHPEETSQDSSDIPF